MNFIMNKSTDYDDETVLSGQEMLLLTIKMTPDELKSVQEEIKELKTAYRGWEAADCNLNQSLKWQSWASDVLYYIHSGSKDNLEGKKLITADGKPTFTNIRDFAGEIQGLQEKNAKKDYKLSNGVIVQATQGEIDICEKYEKKLDKHFADSFEDEEELMKKNEELKKHEEFTSILINTATGSLAFLGEQCDKKTADKLIATGLMETDEFQCYNPEDWGDYFD